MKNLFNTLFNTFRKFEDLIITKLLEPICNFIQKLIGLDCFFWALIIAFIVYAIMFIGIICFVIVPSSMIQWDDRVSGLVFLVIIAVYLLTFLNSEKKFWALNPARNVAYESLEIGCRNPHIEKLNGIAFCFLIPVILSVLGTVLRLAAFFTPQICLVITSLWLINLLTGCTPLAPRKSKLRQLLEKLKTSVSEIETKDAVPQPS